MKICVRIEDVKPLNLLKWPWISRFSTNVTLTTIIHPFIHPPTHPPIHPSIHPWCYSPFWALVSLRRCLHSSLSSACLLHPHIARTLVCPPDDIHPSCSWFSHWYYVLKFPIKTFFGILSSSVLIILPAHPSLLLYNIIYHTCYLYLCINDKFHHCICDASVLCLVLGHKFFVIFSFRMYAAFVPSYVLWSMLHFHNTVLAWLMLYIILFYYFGTFFEI